jgi:hypothetical protein
MTTTELPKWFDGHVGTKHQTVHNPYSGQKYKLNPEELAMYDYLMGLQFIIERKGGLLNPKTAKWQKEMRKGLDWFRKANAEAYMVLLD